ncbi:MAG TPA: DoxX family protein [Bryobacteraceae bacterium]|nr:DoxX family protein [Bryobacteraceae bacterium]
MVLGAAVCLEGVSYVDTRSTTPANWLIGIGALISGLLLIIGYLTPVACIAVLAAAFGVALSVLPANPATLVKTRPAMVFALTILLGVFGLGTGSFSVDSRLFGRREIIIPPKSPQPGEDCK